MAVKDGSIGGLNVCPWSVLQQSAWNQSPPRFLAQAAFTLNLSVADAAPVSLANAFAKNRARRRGIELDVFASGLSCTFPPVSLVTVTFTDLFQIRLTNPMCLRADNVKVYLEKKLLPGVASL